MTVLNRSDDSMSTSCTQGEEASLVSCHGILVCYHAWSPEY